PDLDQRDTLIRHTTHFRLPYLSMISYKTSRLVLSSLMTSVCENIVFSSSLMVPSQGMIFVESSLNTLNPLSKVSGSTMLSSRRPDRKSTRLNSSQVKISYA